MNALNRLAIIPARGGSKRLPRKNVLPLNGRAMLSYPVRTALDSGLFSQVIVSTEDAEIAAAGREAGARVLERPENLADDLSTVPDVCAHVLDILAGEGVRPDSFCCIYATAVFVRPEDLVRSFELLEADPDAQGVMAVSEYPYPPMQALREEEGYLTPMWPEYQNVKSQQYPRLVVSNGTFYWMRTEPFLAQRTFVPERVKPYLLPGSRAVDMDTPEDLELARLLADKLLS